MLLDLFRKKYKVCENIRDFLTWLRASASRNVAIPHPVLHGVIRYDLGQEDQFASVAEHPNLIFLFILLGEWARPVFIQEFNHFMTLGGEPLLDKDAEILVSFSVGRNNADVCHHWCQLFCEAQLVQENNFDSDYSQRVDSATVMRGAYSLLRHFDVHLLEIN